MTRKITSLLFFLITLIVAQAQIDIDFENQDISAWTQSQQGHWEISSNSALQGNYSLHHCFDTSASWHDQISLPLGFDMTTGKTLWQFKIRHGYNPSSSNNWAVILASDKDATQMTPSDGFSGYAIGVNFNNFTDDSLKLFRIDNGTITPILNTGINWEQEVGTGDYLSLMIIRNANGQWTIFAGKNSSYDSLIFRGQITDNTYSSAQYFGIYYEYTAAQDQKLWFDDLHIITNYNQNNSTLTVSQITDTLPSTAVSQPGKDILTLNFSAPASDNAVTTLEKIIILPGSTNQIADWRNLIATCLFKVGQTNYYGIVNQNSLIFNTNINLNPGENIQGTIYLQLKTNPQIVDNKKLSLTLSADMIISSYDGNSFASSTFTKDFVYSVEATQLKFSQTPISVRLDNPFFIQIIATDVYGNKDIDANYTVSLSRDIGSGTLSSASSLTKTMSGGIVEWNDLTYNAKDTFRLRAYTPDLGYFYSPLIIGSDYVFYLNDDFEDGDITDWQENYPGHWQASADNPIMGQYSLHHTFDNSTSATEWIVHPLQAVNLSDTMLIWDFYIRYENSSPSSSNNWNVVLMSDNNPSDGEQYNGYGVGINWNETSDLLKLWKITDGTPSEIISSTINWQEQISATQNVHVLIKRYSNAQWELYIDTTRNNSFSLIGSVNDATYQDANYFGIRYQYTSSQDRKLYLDNIYFGEPIPDTQPPEIDTVIATSSDTVLVQFNEKINTAQINTSNFNIENLGQPDQIYVVNDRTIKLILPDTLSEGLIYNLVANNITDLSGNTATNITKSLVWIAFHITSINSVDSLNITINLNRSPDPATVDKNNFSISPYNGQITNASLSDNSITLTLSVPLQVYNQYTVHSSIKDLYGNSIKDSVKDFYFYLPQLFDVIVNELMTDVNPAPPALPANKYIELYNRAPVPINLSGWTLSIGSKNFTIPDNTIIPALGYAIVCSPEAQAEFQNLALTIPVLNEYYLTSSNTIVLRDYTGKIIEILTYSSLWYGDPDKDDGGWSLERIDPDNICSQENNWHASENPVGGTPGFVNSVIAQNQDTTPPQLIRVQVLSSSKLELYFNEIISQQSASEQINFIINNQATPLTIEYDPNDAKRLILNFLVNFLDGTNSLKISNLSDNCQNIMPDTVVEFYYESIHIVDVQPINKSQLKIYFSEPVEKNSAEQITNYFVDKGIDHPSIALRDAYHPNVVHLIFPVELQQDTIYHISISGIFDLNNNQCDSTVKSFVFHIPQVYDVVFNEFMTDINPAPANLTPIKYIELFNTRNFDLWLEGWTMKIDYKEITFPAVKIPAYSYLILKSTPDTLCNCQVLNILNSSDIKTQANYGLYSAQGQIIDFISLNINFWNDEQKASGGYSTERINPLYHCENTDNWATTNDPNGGTPGQRNSVYSDQVPDQQLKISAMHIENAKTIEFSTNYPVINSSLTDTFSYLINGIHPLLAEQSNYQTVKLILKSMLTPGQNIISINISDDCHNTLNFDTTINYQFIHVQEINTVDSNILWVKFSEEPGSNYSIAQNYLVNQQINPQVIIKNANQPNIVYLYFDQNFNTGQNTIKIHSITDKFGNTIPDYSAEFYYYKPHNNDILINEILFNPLPQSARYIELYNNSDYPVYLHHLALANMEDSLITNITPITSDFFLLPPHDYVAITTDTANVKQNYPYHGQNFVQANSLPSLGSDKGNIAVICGDSIIDYLIYDEQMHNTLISNPDGVALERISFDLATNDPQNWTSAASTVNYGTPAMKNSQAASIDSLTMLDAQLSLSSQTISPDNDGYQDYLMINIQTQDPDVFAQILIINRNGLKVKTLSEQVKLARQNVFRWDGTDDNGQKLENGIYIIIAKLFTSGGKVKIIRKPVAIVQKK